MTEQQVPNARNFVAKHMNTFNRAATHVDRKKQQKTPRKLKNQKIDY